MKTPTRFPAVLLLIAGLVIATEARADGGFVAVLDPIQEPTQTALIRHHDGVQEMILEVGYEGSARDFGWIVPLPAAPEISWAPHTFFETLAQTTEALALGAGRRGGGSVFTTVHQARKELPADIVATHVYGPEDRAAFARWMDDHRFQVTPAVQRTVDEYLDRGWVFVAMNIAAKYRERPERFPVERGAIAPIHFCFPTAEPVFPLRISAINPGPSDVLLYVLDDRAVAPRTGRHLNWTLRVGDARRFANSQLGLAPDDASTRRTTRLFARVDPAAMTQDIYFTDHDVAESLRSFDTGERTDALMLLVNEGRRDLAGVILELLEPRPVGPIDERLRAETLTALWAVGEFGLRDGAGVLLRWVASDDAAAREEALTALARMDIPEAEPALIARLASGRSAPGVWPPTETGNLVIHRRLSRGLRPEHRALIIEAVAQRGAHDAWRELVRAKHQLRDTGPLQLLALAAQHGDAGARQTMIDLLVESAASADLDLYNGMSWSRDVMFGGKAPPPPIVRPREVSNHVAEWPALHWTIALLDDAPETAADIFRAVAANEAVRLSVRSRLKAEVAKLDRREMATRPVARWLPPPDILAPGDLATDRSSSAPAGASGSS